MRSDYPDSGTPSPTNANTTFPPPPNPNAPVLSSSPSSVNSRAASNALTRALSLASKKLFGSSGPRTAYYKEYAPPASSPRRQTILSSRSPGLGLQVNGARDPMEEALLATLEELAQKTEVLTHWADEMYEYVKAIPQSTLLLLFASRAMWLMSP